MFGWVLFLSQLLIPLLSLLNSLFPPVFLLSERRAIQSLIFLRFRSGAQLKGPSLCGLGISLSTSGSCHTMSSTSLDPWMVSKLCCTPHSLQATPPGLPSSEKYTHWCLVSLRRADRRKTRVFCRPRKELGRPWKWSQGTWWGIPASCCEGHGQRRATVGLLEQGPGVGTPVAQVLELNEAC